LALSALAITASVTSPLDALIVIVNWMLTVPAADGGGVGAGKGTAVGLPDGTGRGTDEGAGNGIIVGKGLGWGDGSALGAGYGTLEGSPHLPQVSSHKNGCLSLSQNQSVRRTGRWGSTANKAQKGRVSIHTVGAMVGAWVGLGEGSELGSGRKAGSGVGASVGSGVGT
jgi:hypothetical protein